jgi:hypothetical protein
MARFTFSCVALGNASSASSAIDQVYPLGSLWLSEVLIDRFGLGNSNPPHIVFFVVFVFRGSHRLIRQLHRL